MENGKMLVKKLEKPVNNCRFLGMLKKSGGDAFNKGGNRGRVLQAVGVMVAIFLEDDVYFAAQPLISVGQQLAIVLVGDGVIGQARHQYDGNSRAAEIAGVIDGVAIKGGGGLLGETVPPFAVLPFAWCTGGGAVSARPAADIQYRGVEIQAGNAVGMS